MENQQVRDKRERSVGLRVVSVYLFSILISFFTASVVGSFYNYLFKVERLGASLLFPNFGSSLEGFIYSYVFLVSLFATLLIIESKKLFLTWFVGTIVLILLFFLGGGFKQLLFLLALSIAGFVVGLMTRFLLRKLRLASSKSY
ncbi:MAG: hypothetical protein A3H06_00770 [Candidatus Colwellbacteria bacterium RIFCSPLOWO2_12_FULL_44_13]|uniref:Uncharacterized protein n=2 Tax=Candidatus Colwelliibacteriota TaxID=1817904 RepID=A0A1G1Z869_9BACT|nr:MAG: hypothetical protein A3I31_01545 [Candidatus Colwellbacteria bacterium RIFCSPLOWO2_02_FULL_44_20b]OGY61388.1 MAG: hypothetical protein A3H06_00770 [Candidatus Colwellbacteria bacterium RIFCSPLOWO2_12_FULL_44_13]